MEPVLIVFISCLAFRACVTHGRRGASLLMIGLDKARKSRFVHGLFRWVDEYFPESVKQYFPFSLQTEENIYMEMPDRPALRCPTPPMRAGSVAMEALQSDGNYLPFDRLVHSTSFNCKPIVVLRPVMGSRRTEAGENEYGGGSGLYQAFFSNDSLEFEVVDD